MQGTALINRIAQATGLPRNLINHELESLVVKTGIQPEDISLDDIREILAKYLQEILLKAKEELNSSGL